LPALARYPGLRLVDTPGLGSVFKYNTETSEEWLPQVGAAIVAVSAIALAWLAAQDTVVAPIASARTTEQLAELLAVARIELGAAQLAALTAAAE